MKINYISKNYKIGTRFKEVLEKKLMKLQKYFTKDCDIKVNCSEQADVEKLEITIKADNLFIRTEVVSDNMYNNIDTALPKIEKQIIKAISRNKTRNVKEFANELEFITELPVVEKNKIVKTKKFELDPITVDDAEYNMDALGQNFFIFLNAETGNVNVIYKRTDGNLGLIEVTY